MAKIEINMNESVSVELTEAGFKMWKDYEDAIFTHSPEMRKDLSHYKAEAVNGMVTMQLWALMMIFGKYIRMGMIETPFKNNSIHFQHRQV